MLVLLLLRRVFRLLAIGLCLSGRREAMLGGGGVDEKRLGGSGRGTARARRARGWL